MSNTNETNEAIERARQIIEFTNIHLFLTGKAGTGKTTFLRRLKQENPKNMVVLAPTGIAAINAGGSTIHSFFQLSFAPFMPNDIYRKMNLKLRKEKIKLLRSLDLIIIDEISMVRADLLDQIDAVLRQYRNPYIPFGGVQLLMIGDLQQLPPVAKEEEWQLLSQYYETPYFFSSHALQQTDYLTVELNHIYRQNDAHFIALLNKIRNNKADAHDLQQLNQRFIPDFQPEEGVSYIRLMTHNAHVQQYNEQQLDLIDAPSFAFGAEIKGNFPESSFPTESSLVLKKGAQVMFIKNDPEKRYYNGTLGEVIALDASKCTVRTAHTNMDVIVAAEEWLNTRYALNEETQAVEEQVEGSFKQLPLKLAWAITVHKSQGLTFEHAIVDVHAAFTHGQTYVALSRCKTLDGLVLSAPIPPHAIIQEQAVCRFNEKVAQDQERAVDLEQLRTVHCFHLIAQLFDFSALRVNLEAERQLLASHFQKNFPDTVRAFNNATASLYDQVIAVADKFRNQYQRLNQQTENGVVSAELQERIQKGAQYFSKMLEPLLKLVQETQLPTDNKEVRKRMMTTRDTLLQELTEKHHLLAHVCLKGFEVRDFQKAKTRIAVQTTMTPDTGKATAAKAKEEKPTVPSEMLNPRLYKQLYEWRSKKAAELGIAPYMVIQGKALIGISNLRPKNKTGLESVPYFGKVAMEKYGEEVLEILHRYEKGLSPEEVAAMDNRLQLALREPHKETKEVRPQEQFAKGMSYLLTLDYFQKGMSIAKIAQHRQLSTDTIQKHLLTAVEAGKLALNELVPQAHIDLIRQYVKQQSHPEELKLTPIREALNNAVEYYEIRAVLDQFFPKKD